MRSCADVVWPFCASATRYPVRSQGSSSSRRGVVLVEGRRNIELVRLELSQKLLALPSVDVWAAGRQGVCMGLQAMARQTQAVQFVMRSASITDLDAAGLQWDGQIQSQHQSAFAGVHMALQSERRELPEPVKVFHVSQRSNLDFIPLAKAIATELRWTPAGQVLAVESLLVGKAKNVWTRAFSLARAVSQVYDWQVNPRAAGAQRPFQCVAQERAVDMELDVTNSMEGSAARGKQPRALRLVLLAHGEPPARADGSPRNRKASETEG
mmetsp:Transcript_42520/g.95432  ORF Transcript_42520/g.95432 Transcript_42520/m.95432 type:complete len:268 (+) Transcript_42520:35-838(+)